MSGVCRAVCGSSVPEVRGFSADCARRNRSHELATALTVEVEATYAMIPSKDRIDPTLDHHTWRTSRNASVFGVDRPLPPFTSEMINPPKDVFPRFIANSGTMGRMLLRPADNQILVAESGLVHSQVEALFPGRHIATKSRVTMVRDFPVYDFDAFNQTLLERSQFLVRPFSIPTPAHDVTN